MTTLLQQIANGLVLGATIGLIALGYTMVYGIIQLINFAHGEVFMVGAFGGLAVYRWVLPESVRGDWYISLPAMLVGGVVVAVVIAVLMERFAYRPLRNAPRLAPLITALGVSVALQEAIRLWFPNADAAQPFPRVFIDAQVRLGDVSIPASGLLLIVVSVILAVLLQTYISRSRMGRAMRATSQDRDTARLMGVNPDRVIVLTFVLGATLAGIAGVLYGSFITNVDNSIGFQNGIFAFTAAVLGGIGSLRGAVIGAFIIGLIKSLGGQYMPGGTQYDYVWIFVVLILVLVFRPQGLFGEAERVRA
ncbi:branched-chain amino acid ABC transporter permease [Actinophytocola algeriensis]|uniref:Branched-chain amino acid transport system permease protein n=1 Tax=Actinophytocola algeriensis TaxID=1768010 RepID=A0A7W7VJE9_9PSEU|nr:branched-chain amino acid ABC transporter permease [Actinophytocola algeriensis]MBB4912481.1 branched-chain amino acid transport system permease protein [Actinophytocola algeriensis]MBE1480946.1 branched-chain amino acid transport system permease protein [Actinophytocola algeriensis]